MSYIQREFGGKLYSFKFTQPAITEVGVLNEGNIDEKTFAVKNWTTFVYAVLWGGLYGWYKVKRLEMEFDFEQMCEWADKWAKEEDTKTAAAFLDVVNCYLNEVGLLPKQDKKKEPIKKSPPKNTRRSVSK